MYETFGPTVAGNGRVTFNLFLPDNKVDPAQYTRGGDPKIREIRVRGDFQHQLGGQDWDLASAPQLSKTAHPHGWLWTATLETPLPEGFYQYKYFVTFENDTDRWVTDPCTKYGGVGESENAAFVVGGSRLDVQPVANPLPPEDWIIYELMIDDFTAEFRQNRAPIDAIHDKLDYLQSLGINAIEFMPWTAWPGADFSWGYDPFQFFAVEYRYVHDATQTADKIYRLKRLINALHERGIHVIMDGVFNHVRAGINPNKGFPYVWLYQNPEESPYVGQFERGGFFEEFDYANGCVQQFIHDVCQHWLDTYQLDGIRFDFTIGFFKPGDPNSGITRLIGDLRQHLAAQNRHHVALIVEHLTDNRYLAINDTNQMGATGCWFDPIMYQAIAACRNGRIPPELLRTLNSKQDFQPDKWPVTYIENHDHARLLSEVGRSRWYKSQPAAIALFTSPGMVMIYNGQEFGEDYWLPPDGAERVSPRPLRWAQLQDDFVGQRLRWLYGRLATIRHNHPALRSANAFPATTEANGYGVINEQIIIYHRYGQTATGLVRYMVVLNFGDWDQWVDVPFSTNGVWEELLGETAVTVTDYRLPQAHIPSNWGRIFFQEGM
ncbi:MAG: alpha-amylase family glycosyl hydrolase [Chloroflexota bacterium]